MCNPLSGPIKRRQIVEASKYVALTQPCVAFIVNEVWQFMQTATDDLWQVVK